VQELRSLASSGTLTTAIRIQISARWLWKVDSLPFRHQSFCRVSWKSAGDYKSPTIPYCAVVREVENIHISNVIVFDLYSEVKRHNWSAVTAVARWSDYWSEIEASRWDTVGVWRQRFTGGSPEDQSWQRGSWFLRCERWAAAQGWNCTLRRHRQPNVDRSSSQSYSRNNTTHYDELYTAPLRRSIFTVSTFKKLSGSADQSHVSVSDSISLWYDTIRLTCIQKLTVNQHSLAWQIH